MNRRLTVRQDGGHEALEQMMLARRCVPSANAPTWSRPLGLLAAALALALLVAACGGGEEPSATGLSDPGDLRGKTIAVASLGETFTLETRYLLQEKYGLDVSLEGGDVTIIESPVESLPTLLRNGDVDAAIMLHLGAFGLLKGEEFAVLSHVTEEMRELTGGPIMGSILVTYADVAEQKTAALSELNRLLAESVTYFKANRDEVIEAVAADQGADPEFLRWWWQRQDLPLGDRSEEAQLLLLDVWEAARAIGDIESYPQLTDVLFDAEAEEPEAATEGDRTTISLALLDDPSRRAVLYAIERGIVTSDTVDVDVTYLLPSTIDGAAPARQYDVIEATPLAVPRGAERGLAFVILSAGLQNLDGTLLFVRGEAD